MSLLKSEKIYFFQHIIIAILFNNLIMILIELIQ